MKPLKILLLVLSFAFVNSAISQTVYTTKTGEKYHTSSCRYLKYSKKEYTLEKVKALGFTACVVCKPDTKTIAVKKIVDHKQKRTTPIRTVTAKQCTGKTKAKKRCKRKTKSANQRCYQH